MTKALIREEIVKIRNNAITDFNIAKDSVVDLPHLDPGEYALKAITNNLDSLISRIDKKENS